MPCKESFAVTWQLETLIFSSQKDGQCKRRAFRSRRIFRACSVRVSLPSLGNTTHTYLRHREGYYCTVGRVLTAAFVASKAREQRKSVEVRFKLIKDRRLATCGTTIKAQQLWTSALFFFCGRKGVAVRSFKTLLTDDVNEIWGLLNGIYSMGSDHGGSRRRRRR